MAGALTVLRPASPRPVYGGGLGSAHCDVCDELLLEYITAGNDVVELQSRLSRCGADPAAGDSQQRLKGAAARKSASHTRLVRHQHEHLTCPQ